MRLGLLRVIGRGGKDHSRAGKSEKARQAQLENLRLRHRKIPNLRENSLLTSTDTSEIPAVIPPIDQCNIIEFCEGILEVSLYPVQEVILRSLYALPLTGEQTTIYRKLTGLDIPFEPDQEKTELIACLGARSGKSFLQAILSLYETVARAKVWLEKLQPGESAYAVQVATNREQAQNVLSAEVSRLIGNSPVLSRLTSEIYKNQVTFKTGLKIISMPCSAVSIRGLPIYFCTLDEFAFFRLESLNSDQQVFSAIIPRMAQFPKAKLIVTSTPGARQGLFFDLYDQGAEMPGRLRVKGSTLFCNPTIDRKIIERELKRNPLNAEREFGGEFAQTMDNFFTDEMLDTSLRLLGSPTVNPGCQYYMSLDQSGLAQKDHFSLAVGHGQAGQYRVDYILDWRAGEGDLPNVLGEIRRVARRFSITRVTIDKFSQGWVKASLAEIGLTAEIRPDLATIYSNFRPLLSDKRILLPDDPKLRVSMQNTQAAFGPKSNRLGIFHRRDISSGHGDLIDSCVSVIFSCSRRAVSGERIKVRLGEAKNALISRWSILGGNRKPASLLNPTGQGSKGFWGQDKRGLKFHDQTYKADQELAHGHQAKPDPDLETEE